MSYRPLSQMPKLPVKFHKAQPQPAFLNSSSVSCIQDRTNRCGEKLWAPNSPTITPTPRASKSFQGLTTSRAIVPRVTYLPSFCRSGQIGSGQLSSQLTHDAL